MSESLQKTNFYVCVTLISVTIISIADFKQKPLITFQTHVTHIFKPGIWAAASYGISRLGETAVNDVDKNDSQNASRFGVAFAHRIGKKSSLKFAYTSGVTARYGADFNTFVVAYQLMWFDKKQVKQLNKN